MGRKLSNGEHLFRAVLKNPKMHPIAEFPKSTQDSFRAMLEGSRLPENPGQKRTFKRHFSKFAGKMLKPQMGCAMRYIALGASDLIVESNFESLGRAFARAKLLADICMHSANPPKYAALLSNEYVSPSLFASRAAFFTSREVVFSDVPEDALKLRGILLSLEGNPSKNSIKRALRLFKKIDDSPRGMEELFFTSAYSLIPVFLGGREGILEAACELWPKKAKEFRELDGATMLMEEEEGKIDELPSLSLSLGKLGLQYMHGAEGFPKFLKFKRGFSSSFSGVIAEEPEIMHNLGISGKAIANFLVVDSDSKSTIQHELQHLFDSFLGFFTNSAENERRAYLGALAFAPDSGLLEEILIFRSWMGNMHKILGGPHALAKDMIYAALKERGIKSKSPIGKIQFAALDLLNSAYKKLVGLTYAEILEPFSKIDPSLLETECEY